MTVANKYKLALILLSVILVVIVGKRFTPTPNSIVTPSATPTPTKEVDANGWTTYNGKGFSIKYPPGWHDGESPDQLLNYDPSLGGGDFNPKVDSGKLKIQMSVVSSDQDLQTYIKNNQKERQENDPFVKITSHTSPIQVSGYNAISEKVTYPGFSWKTIFIKHPSKSIIFVAGLGLDFANYDSLANQILSTFRFTDTSTNWHTYTNTDWGISFDYPTTWNVITPDNDPKMPIQVELVSGQYPVITFVYIANPKNLSLSQIDKQNEIIDRERGTGIETQKLTPKDPKTVTVGNGYSALYEQEFFCEPSRCERYIFQYTNKIIAVTIFPGDKQYIDHILSTFKFTD